MKSIRERLEEKEKRELIPQATLSSSSKGRKQKEKQCDTRTVFMVDRDRIIHSKSFRRLKHKTQVYIKATGDHYRTRLTHTLEVSQIARTIGAGIGLNEPLIEAIALGHDIGHVAFAHNGEDVLNKLLPGGFKHNHHSIRVLEKLENDGKGLNLTFEVLDGILKHSGFNKVSEKPSTLEGQVVRFSDKIAYVNHDIDDSVRAGFLKLEDIPKNVLDVLGYTHSERINTLVHGCIEGTLSNIESGKNEVILPKEIGQALIELREFMFENIYLGSELGQVRKKAEFILEHVYEYFMKNPKEMPELYVKICEEEGLERGVADYLAGMSDDYCIHVFNKIYVPKHVIY